MSIFLIIIFLIITLPVSGVKVNNHIKYNQRLSIGKKEFKALSTTSQQLLREYNEIPTASRPYANFRYMLESLDKKYDEDRAFKSGHFGRRVHNSSHNGYRYEFSWDECNCHHYRYNYRRKDGEPKCASFPEYMALHEVLDEIRVAVIEQERQAILAGASEGMNQVEQFLADARQEIEILNSTTKELSNR